MSTRELRFTVDLPRDMWLKPEVPAGAEGAMIGWVRDAAPIDDGIPEAVALVITRALTSRYSLTFSDPNNGGSDQWEKHGTYATRYLKPDGIQRLNPSAGYGLTATSNPDVAARLFDTDESLWVEQLQVAFLSPRECQPPDIDFQDLHNFLRSRTLDCGYLQYTFGSSGLLTPGPDGDFAQVILCQPGAMNELTQSLHLESEAAGLHFAEVSGAEFERTKWFLEKVGT